MKAEETEGAKEGLGVGERFRALYDEWEEATGGLSNPRTTMAHPAFKEMVAMGEAILPDIFEEMTEGRRMEGIMLLHTITGEVPFPREEAGNVARMTERWFEWWAKRQPTDAPPSAPVRTPNPFPDQVLTPLSAEAAWSRYNGLYGSFRPGDMDGWMADLKVAREAVEAAIRAPLESIAANPAVQRTLDWWDDNVSMVEFRAKWGREFRGDDDERLIAKAIAAVLAGVPKEAGGTLCKCGRGFDHFLHGYHAHPDARYHRYEPLVSPPQSEEAKANG